MPLHVDDPVVFVHPHGLYAAGFESALSNLRIITDQHGRHSTIAILEDPSLQSELQSGTNILVFKPAPRLEFLAREHGWNLLAAPSLLNRRFENKLAIDGFFREAGLPTLPSHVQALEESSWNTLVSQLGFRLVIQTERGQAGSSSDVVASKEEWRTLCQRKRGYQARVMPYLAGDTWTVNACATRYGTLVARPFLQLQGISMTGATNPLTTCGNWHTPMADDLAREVILYSERFGDLLSRHGYRGWFGLDALIESGKLIGFIECNPRLTASAGIFTEMQVEAKLSPFIALHVLELLDRPYDLDLAVECAGLFKGFSESHLVLRHGSTITLPQEGICGANLEWKREGRTWHELANKEILVRRRAANMDIASNEPMAILISRTRPRIW